MSKYDDLIREGRDTDALRLFAREYYEYGKMGHTRLLNAVRVADRCDELEAEAATLRADNEGLRANAMIQEHIIENGSNPLDKDKIVKLTMENSAYRADNDKLKKALAGAVEDISTVAYNQKVMPCVVCQHWEGGMIEQCLGCHELSSHFKHRGQAGREGQSEKIQILPQ
ncbi:MAG: hypothetical protein AB9835_14455 [Eubacteriales bacterium]